MVNPRKLNFEMEKWILLISILLLTGCNMPSLGTDDSWRDTIGVQIIAPADGSQWDLGDEIEITSRVSAPNIVQSLRLIVNGAEMRYDHFYHPTFFSGTIFQKWTPKSTGIYTLQTLLQDAKNKAESNIITILVGEPDVGTLRPVEHITTTPTHFITPTSATETATLTPTFTQTVGLTQPEAIANVNLNCRLGPALAYETVWYFLAGETAPLVGRNEDGNWLVVQRLDGLGECWVSANYVIVTGNIGGLVVIEPPPLPPMITPTFTQLPYNSCADYPDYATCNADPMGFGTCSWNTGLNVCE